MKQIEILDKEMLKIIDERIPVTIITGFLGSGKTTLLNQLIKDNQQKKFAIIENEFGEINIDSELIINSIGSNIFELSNGCICCTLNDNLLDLLHQLLQSEKPFNHLIIESTGIADPSSIIEPFISNYQIQLQFRLDSLVCVVDSEIIEEIVQEEQEAIRQIVLADVIIMNKKSRVQPNYYHEIFTKIKQLNPVATYIETDYANLKGIDILNMQSLGLYQTEIYVDKSILHQAHHHQCHDGCGCTSHNHHSHDSSFFKHSIQSHSFIIEGQMDFERFSLWLDYFLMFNQHKIYRLKGIIAFADTSNKMIVQSVRTAAMMMEGNPWGYDEKRQNKLVFIGKHIDEDMINENLRSFVIRD